MDPFKKCVLIVAAFSLLIQISLGASMRTKRDIFSFLDSFDSGASDYQPVEAREEPVVSPLRSADDSNAEGDFGDTIDPELARPGQQDLGLGLNIPSENRVSQSKAIKEDLDRIRLEIIRHQLLSKLRMTSRPNTTFPRIPLPSPLAQRAAPQYQATSSKQTRETEEDYYGKTTQVIIFANDVSGNCYNELNKPIGCFQFDLKDKLAGKGINSAKLWLYKLRDPADSHNQTIVVSEITNPNHSKHKSGRIVGTVDTPLRRGWIKFDFKHTIYRWIQRPSRNRGIEVLCKTCSMDRTDSPVGSDGEYKPFIVIDVEQKARRRVRRSQECTETSSVCCRQQFYVSFEKLGLSDWVRYPSGYYANYCKGSCAEPTGLTQYHHTSIIHRVGVSGTVDPAVKAEMTSCCTPRRMSSLSLLYFTEENYMVQKNIPNMIVESCECS